LGWDLHEKKSTVVGREKKHTTGGGGGGNSNNLWAGGRPKSQFQYSLGYKDIRGTAPKQGLLGGKGQIYLCSEKRGKKGEYGGGVILSKGGREI